ncbi:hypothetical protein A3A79_00730 [Candidatus Gottesmanbacteria bacterium RIFCSPLOWO2_01_FULL_43_11b]|uniref:Peptidase M24 domain-containing protein n=1 Tax=Candidatus Gottesmanbacteria bacterium RIFCSPLOWO2_01_FULL_43_11b TaxID=1798392 RepID=A0A1F6AG34_9BACT|nr:MAG: hypothetical protein A3A79_00730 [Candidatus Gottesmanbacteria bacterium RIFCSPLOWO2_01_FULL_43_11b]
MKRLSITSNDSVLITNPTNILYLTGFVGVERRDAYVLVTKNKTYLFTTSLYLEAAQKLNVTVIEISREKPIEQELSKLVKTVAFEENDITVAEYNKLKKLLRLKPAKNRIEKMRMIKREDEIAKIKLAAKITDACFTYIVKRIRTGVTEARLAWEIEGFFKYRAGDVAFSPIVAFNENSSKPHYNSRSNNPLRKNSLILLDFGARVNGYCADMTRVVFLGKPKAEWVKAYDAVLQAQQAAISSNSRSGAERDRIARESIQKSGFDPYAHSLGHNVGLDIHESPRLSIKKDANLLPGMVFTIEPGVYIEGQFGIRIEDLVLLKATGIEILSHSSYNTFV